MDKLSILEQRIRHRIERTKNQMLLRTIVDTSKPGTSLLPNHAT